MREEERCEEENEAGKQEEQGQEEMPARADDGLSQEVVAEDVGAMKDEAEEGQGSKGLVAPARVSQAEREEHERTHTPYRAWCPYCVRGWGYKAAHKKQSEAEKKEEEREKRGVPRICMDYFYMSAEDETEKNRSWWWLTNTPARSTHGPQGKRE